MAFHTPPEVLLRQCIRSFSGMPRRVKSIPTPIQCAALSYKAAVCTKIGEPLQIQDKKFPTGLGATEVLISTHAVGLNFADILTCKGKYQERLKTPFVPGGEISGKVIEVGADVGNVQIGDRVFVLGFAKKGGAAEYYVTESNSVFPVPSNLTLVQAAGTIVSYGTAMMALTKKAKLRKRERVLVTAAAGATGLAAVDIAKNVFECEVIAVCGGEKKCQFLKERGADQTIDYTKEKVRDRVKEITKGEGVDVVMDQVGGDTLLECVKSLGFEGRALTIGYASGNIPNIPANLLLLKSAALIGVFWGSYAVSNPLAFVDSITQVLQAVGEEKVHPHVGTTFPLSEINDAFQFVLDRRNIGKVVLKMKEEDHPAEL